MMNIASEAFDHLTEKQKAVWVPIMLECRSQYETAALLGIKRPAVRDRITKAKKAYTKYIKAHRNDNAKQS